MEKTLMIAIAAMVCLVVFWGAWYWVEGKLPTSQVQIVKEGPVIISRGWDILTIPLLVLFLSICVTGFQKSIASGKFGITDFYVALCVPLALAGILFTIIVGTAVSLFLMTFGIGIPSLLIVSGLSICKIRRVVRQHHHPSV